MSERDYYDILGLRSDADGMAVNRTYWLLARKYQEQAANDPRAHQLLDELNEAYSVLGTPTLRATYDAARPPSADPDSLSERPSKASNVLTQGAFALGAPAHAQPGGRVNIGATAGYGAAALVCAVGVSAGLWAGSLLPAALSAGGAILAVAALIRERLVSGHREPSNPVDHPIDATDVPFADRGGRRQERLSAPIITRRNTSADELRLSTASMVDRWRSSAAGVANTGGVNVERAPDPTLVDIFRSEEELGAPSEPLSAVLEVLRGSRHPA